MHWRSRSDHCRSIKMSIILYVLNVDSFFTISVASVENRHIFHYSEYIFAQFCAHQINYTRASCAHIHSNIQTRTTPNHNRIIRCGADLRAVKCVPGWMPEIQLGQINLRPNQAKYVCVHLVWIVQQATPHATSTHAKNCVTTLLALNYYLSTNGRKSDIRKPFYD